MPKQARVRYSLLSLNCETQQVLKNKSFKVKCLLHYIVKSEVTNTSCFEIWLVGQAWTVNSPFFRISDQEALSRKHSVEWNLLSGLLVGRCLYLNTVTCVTLSHVVKEQTLTSLYRTLSMLSHVVAVMENWIKSNIKPLPNKEIVLATMSATLSTSLSATMSSSMSAISFFGPHVGHHAGHLVGHLVHLHVGHYVHLHVGRHVSHHVGHHYVISTLCEVSETQTERKSESFYWKRSSKSALTFSTIGCLQLKLVSHPHRIAPPSLKFTAGCAIYMPGV